MPNSYSSLVPNVVDLAFLVKGKPPELIIGPIWINSVAIGIHALRSLAWSAIAIFISILVSLVSLCSACIFQRGKETLKLLFPNFSVGVVVVSHGTLTVQTCYVKVLAE